MIRHLVECKCELYREGSGHSMWKNPDSGAMQAVPRHSEISNRLARGICKRESKHLQVVERL